jgi:hypothetical protein
MTPSNDNPLSANQQAMLDLALACDLMVSDPSQHDSIKAHHKRITTQAEAMIYIKSVEHRISSRRKIRYLPGSRGQGPAQALPTGATPQSGQPRP